MICPKCKGKLHTIDTVNTPDNEVYRRRQCKECGYEFYTIEFEAECDDKFKSMWNKYHRTSSYMRSKKRWEET